MSESPHDCTRHKYYVGSLWSFILPNFVGVILFALTFSTSFKLNFGLVRIKVALLYLWGNYIYIHTFNYILHTYCIILHFQTTPFGSVWTPEFSRFAPPFRRRRRRAPRHSSGPPGGNAGLAEEGVATTFFGRDFLLVAEQMKSRKLKNGSFLGLALSNIYIVILWNIQLSWV